MKSSHRFLAGIFFRRKRRSRLVGGVLFIVGFRIPTQCFFVDLQPTISRKKTKKLRALWSSDINIKLTAVRKKTPKTQKTAKRGMQVPSKIGHFQ